MDKKLGGSKQPSIMTCDSWPLCINAHRHCDVLQRLTAHVMCISVNPISANFSSQHNLVSTSHRTASTLPEVDLRFIRVKVWTAVPPNIGLLEFEKQLRHTDEVTYIGRQVSQHGCKAMSYRSDIFPLLSVTMLSSSSWNLSCVQLTVVSESSSGASSRNEPLSVTPYSNNSFSMSLDKLQCPMHSSRTLPLPTKFLTTLLITGNDLTSLQDKIVKRRTLFCITWTMLSSNKTRLAFFRLAATVSVLANLANSSTQQRKSVGQFSQFSDDWKLQVRCGRLFSSMCDCSSESSAQKWQNQYTERSGANAKLP